MGRRGHAKLPQKLVGEGWGQTTQSHPPTKSEPGREAGEPVNAMVEGQLRLGAAADLPLRPFSPQILLLQLEGLTGLPSHLSGLPARFMQTRDLFALVVLAPLDCQPACTSRLVAALSGSIQVIFRDCEDHHHSCAQTDAAKLRREPAH